eukprot:4498345-Amphidinium_carterae.1
MLLQFLIQYLLEAQEKVYGLRQRNLPSWALSPRQALDAESLLRPWNTPRQRTRIQESIVVRDTLGKHARSFAVSILC